MKFSLIEDLLDELRASSCRKIDDPSSSGDNSGYVLSAAMSNRVNEAMGDHRDVCVDESVPGAQDGSNLFMALMYQNLTLAARLENLEDALEKAGIPCEK